MSRAPFVYYRALDPQKGSWDGYGCFPIQDGFLAFVADAPSGASISTPVLIHDFLEASARDLMPDPDRALGQLAVADCVNRLQEFLRARGRKDAVLYQSTLSLALLCGGRLYCGAVGDSMALLLRNGALYRLDAAETWDGALVVHVNEDLRERRQKGPVEFVGPDGAFFEPSRVVALDLRPGDRLVLASDGVADLVPPARLRDLCSNPGRRNALDALFAQERLRDDVTLMILQPDVPAARDVEAELQALFARVEALEAQNSDLARRIQENAAGRGGGLHPAGAGRDAPPASSPGETPRLQARRVGRPACTRLARSMHPWSWIALGFLAGALVIGGYFAWTAPATRQPKPIATPKLAERRPVAPPLIPDSSNCTHVVRKGDTLQKIATEYGVTLAEVLQWNPQQKPDAALQVGLELRVCGGPQ